MFKLFRKRADPPVARRQPARPDPAPTDWTTRRAPPREADLRLSDVAEAWLATLAPEVRPVALAGRFPRIANRLALTWPDPVLTERTLEGLIVDTRGGRQGFPPDVMRELIDLRAQVVQQTPATPAPPATRPSLPPFDFD